MSIEGALVPLHQLTEAMISDIVALFDQVTGANHHARWSRRGPQLPGVIEALSGVMHRWELRLGYPGNTNARLAIRPAHTGRDLVRINLNTDDDGDHGPGFLPSSIRLMSAFTQQVQNYLRQTGPFSWEMWACRYPVVGYRFIGARHYAAAVATDKYPLVKVRLTLDPQGTYTGWIGDADHTPVMVEPDELLFRMKFDYDPQDKPDGYVARFTVQEIS